jgi:hypothetical protein
VNSNSLVQINFPENLVIITVQKQPLSNNSLGKINIRRCKVSCVCFVLNIGPGTVESTIEFNLTLDRLGLKESIAVG